MDQKPKDEEKGALYTTQEAVEWTRKQYEETYSYYVYVHTTPDGKKYVGYGHGNPEDRWERGHGYRFQKRFKAAIDKFGWDAITSEVYRDRLCLNEARWLERELIIRYESWKPEKGYNAKIPVEIDNSPHYSVYQLVFPDGRMYVGRTGQPLERRWKSGAGYKDQPAVRNAIQECGGWDKVTKIRCIEGWCEESAINLEQHLIEVNHTTDPRYGYNKSKGGIRESGWHQSEEAVAKTIAANRGRKNSTDTIQRMKEAAAPRANHVLNEDTGEIYPSQADAAKALGISVSTVSRVINGKQKTAGGIHLSIAKPAEKQCRNPS